MNRIRSLRMQKAMKQEELAKIIHVSQSSLSGYENEKYEPDKKTLLRLASYFGVSIDYLLGIDDTRSHKTVQAKKIPVYSMLRLEAMGISGSILCFINFDTYWKEGDDYFALQVYGDLMAPRILDGDIAIAKRQDSIENNDIAVVQIGRENAAVIRVLNHTGGITFLPFNPKHKPTSYTDNEISERSIKILGKVVEFRGKY